MANDAKLRTYRAVIDVFIEAETDEEAERLYQECEYLIDGHTLYGRNDDGSEYEVER